MGKKDWLDLEIEESLYELAEEEDEELCRTGKWDYIHLRNPEEMLEKIKREVPEESPEIGKAKRYRPRKLRGRLRLRIVLAAALLLTLLLGLGASGTKAYMLEVLQRSRGDEVSTKAKNADYGMREYDEEKVCQEIQEKLGVIPVRLMYQPKGMVLSAYVVHEENGDVSVQYKCDERTLNVYINKKLTETSIDWQTDGETVDKIKIEFGKTELPVYEYKDSAGQSYFSVSFEFYGTYYYLGGMLEKEEFMKILENISIKNV